MVERMHTVIDEIKDTVRDGSVYGTLRHVFDQRRYTSEVLDMWHAYDAVRDDLIAQLQEENPDLHDRFMAHVGELTECMHNQRIEKKKMPYGRRLQEEYRSLAERDAFEILVSTPFPPDDISEEEYASITNSFREKLALKIEENGLQPEGRIYPRPDKPYW